MTESWPGPSLSHCLLAFACLDFSSPLEIDLTLNNNPVCREAPLVTEISTNYENLHPIRGGWLN